jgi:hypothetical protein
VDWLILAILGGGGAALAGSGVLRRSRQTEAAAASSLEPAGDLSHLPAALQRTALWSLGDGGFESRMLHGVMGSGGGDVDVTAFDLETLRERRGEWAYLPVEPPFRIGGKVSVVVCELDRVFPHLLLKRAGRSDQLLDDDVSDHLFSVTKLARDALGVGRSFPAELPTTLPAAALDVTLPEHWRAYGRTIDPVLARAPFHAALERAGRRDLVIELIDSIAVAYPAGRAVAGADPFADLISDALAIVDAVRGGTAESPRGIEHRQAD